MRLLVSLCALLLAAFSFSQELPDWRGYFVGTLGENKVQLDLSLRDLGAQGTCLFLNSGKRVDMVGTVDPAGKIELSVDTENSKLKGDLKVTLSNARKSLVGTWIAAGRKPVNASLKREASYRFRTRKVGTTIETTTATAVFDSGQPFMQAVSQALEKKLQSSESTFYNQATESYETDPQLFKDIAWTSSSSVDIAYWSGPMVSILVTEWQYSGGAHGNTTYFAFNRWVKDGKPSDMRLYHLFREDVDALQYVSDYCIKSLKKARALWIVNGEIVELSEQQLKVFTISPSGLEITFAPYAVGPYSDGSYHVLIPLSELSDKLDPEGPAKYLLMMYEENLKLSEKDQGRSHTHNK